MKYKTTQKEVKSGYRHVICVPYCKAQYLLKSTEAEAYTTRAEGWASNIYDIGLGVAVSTGYAPFGDIRPKYEVLEKYEKKAEEIAHDTSINYDEQLERLAQLLCQFRDEVLEGK